MAPTNSSGGAQGLLCGCLRPTCTGSIPLGVLVHKHSIGIKPTCRVCQKLGQTREFVIPPGADRDPRVYAKSGASTRPRETTAGRRDKHVGDKPSAWTQRQLDESQARIKLLEDFVRSKDLELPTPEQPDISQKNLESLKELASAMQKAGISCPDLDVKIKAAEETN